MELWGGVECTVNRVGDRFRDQLHLTGHHDRIADLDAIATLGVRRLRYPLLWERVAPASLDTCSWAWSDARLERIRALGIAPVAGLLHHGSGPAYTDLLDDAFPAMFARYARLAVERYPWIDDWTPVNEPLTTARFSALYGHWCPHRCDERSFYRALLNQIDAIRGAMDAIRMVNPAARLIQTEDLGETFATPALAPVAAYLNRRRWLTWDLLCGRVGPAHPLWEHIARVGLAERLRVIADDPCPPDVIGVNHYVTSDRFLDDRAERYSEPLPQVGYHDLCAARALDPPGGGVGAALESAWKRYAIPVALTEVQLGCTRDEQLRWLFEAWQACRTLSDAGVEIAGFTPWSLFGAVDWDSLLTRDAGHYEPGVFDIRGGTPRPTALADLVRAFAADAGVERMVAAHPVLANTGWWQRPERLDQPLSGVPTVDVGQGDATSCRPVLITGATGTLGRAFARACTARNLPHVLTDRATLPIEDPAACAQVLERYRPWLVVNAAGWVRVDAAESNAAECQLANAVGAATLARACADRGIRFVTFSSDLVFDGESDVYGESDPRRPLGVYGASKAEAEDRVREAAPDALVIRTAAFFSPHDGHNFAVAVERCLRHGGTFAASAQHWITPTYVPHLVDTTLDLAIDGARDAWHLSNGERVTWFDFACRIADGLGLDSGKILASGPDPNWVAPRPRSSALATQRGQMLPSLGAAIDAHCRERRSRMQPGRGSHRRPAANPLCRRQTAGPSACSQPRFRYSGLFGSRGRDDGDELETGDRVARGRGCGPGEAI